MQSAENEDLIFDLSFERDLMGSRKNKFFWENYEGFSNKLVIRGAEKRVEKVWGKRDFNVGKEKQKCVYNKG